MADITALQNIVNSDTQEVASAQKSVDTAQSNLEAVQSALTSFQAKLDAANAVAASLPAGSPERQAAEDKAANYQITVNNYVNNTIPNAQATLQNNTSLLTSATKKLNQDQQALNEAQSAANSSNASSSTSTTDTNSPTPVNNSSSSSSSPTSSGNSPANTNSNTSSSDDSTTGNSSTGSSGSSSNGVGTGNSTAISGSTTNTPSNSNGTNTAGSPLNPARENPLSNFSSYTYNISLYMINPDSFNTYSSGGKLIPTDWKLICRSGGINNTPNANQQTSRAAEMPYDYYIDNLQIVTAVSSKETQTASNSFKFHFQVFEPYGFKFPTQLVKAAVNTQQNSKIRRDSEINETIVALQTQFLLVVRFYGYDAKGNLIDPSNYPQADITKTEKDSVFERSWPIQITGFKFKLDNKLIVYDIEASMVSEQFALGKYRGTTGETFELKGATVKDMLVGNSTGSTKGNVTGLVEYLNQRQINLQKDGRLAKPDTYQITFAPNCKIDEATMIELSDVTLQNTPVKAVTNANQVNVRLSEKAPVVQKLTKPLTVTDEPILSIIDRVITQSSYITNALGIKDKESLNVLDTDKDYTVNSAASSDILAWYHVTPCVTLGEYDNIRKTYSCNINYVIQRYEIPYIRGINIGKKSNYPGPYKRYQHYYMGDTQNAKEIIGYEQDYNLLFFNLAGQGSKAGINNTDDSAPAGSLANDQQSISKEGGWFSKTLGSVKSFLYSPSDQLKARITILGDPDYLMTSSCRGVDVAIKKYYGEDGYTINPSTSQVFIEVNFRDAEDYDKTDTGLLNPANDGDIMFWNYPASIANQINGVAYNVWEVTSTFSKGKFTQELKVAIPPFKDTPGTSATSATASGSTSSSAASAPVLDSSGRLTAASDPRSLIANNAVTLPTSTNNTSSSTAIDDGNTTTQKSSTTVSAGADPRS